MKQIRLLAQYYVDLMMKLGLVRFSIRFSASFCENFLPLWYKWR